MLKKGERAFKIEYFDEDAAQYHGEKPHNTSTETDIIYLMPEDILDGWTAKDTAEEGFYNDKMTCPYDIYPERDWENQEITYYNEDGEVIEYIRVISITEITED